MFQVSLIEFIVHTTFTPFNFRWKYLCTARALMQRGFIYLLAAGMAQHKKPVPLAAFSSRRLQQNALAHFACCLISLSLSQRFNGIRNQPVEKVIVETDNARVYHDPLKATSRKW
jgi:hypothetical protein